MDSVYSPSLDPVEAGAPGAEIEVTPEMIEAGFDVLLQSGVVENLSKGDKFVVRKIFSAMIFASSLALKAK